MRFAAVKSSNLMAAAQGVSNLIRPGEPGAAKNENAKRFRRFLCEQRCRSCGQGKGATSCSRKFDKFTTRRFQWRLNLSCHVERSRGISCCYRWKLEMSRLRST